MGQLVRVAVMLLVAVTAYQGYCQSATPAPESDGMVPRDMQGPPTAAQPQTGSPPTAAQHQTGSPPTAAQPPTGSPTPEDYRGAVARVVSRQRQGMWYWVLVAGAAGLAGITALSLLTVLVHKLCRRSQTVDMRHKQRTASQASGPQKHKVPAGGSKTAVAGADRSYCNMDSAPAPTTRLAESLLSWGSEFELAGDLTENIYSNDYKKPPCGDGKTGRTRPAKRDIYVNGFAL